MPSQPADFGPRAREIELDFIRGLAILAVIDFHSPGHSVVLAPFTALGFANFGWAGVDLFFVLSGFLVGGLLFKEWRLRGGVDSGRFLIRRAFKIWPSYYVFLLISLFTGHRTFGKLLGNFLNIQNYTVGIAHTWTLAVEEHAYLLLVLILAVAARYSVRGKSLFVFLVALAGGVVLNCLVQSALGIETFTHTDTRVDGILFGVVLAMIYHYKPEDFARLQSLWPLWCAFPVAGLLYFRFIPNAWWARSVLWLLADLSGVAIVLLLYRRRTGKTRPLAYRFVAFIGVYSYGIYLWHASVVDPIVKLGHRLPASVRPWWESFAPYVAAILAGIVFTKLVEFPALKLRDRLFPRRVDSAVGIPAEIEAVLGVTGLAESVSGGERGGFEDRRPAPES